MVSSEVPSTYSLIYQTVRRIPYGRVATYGQIARVAGLPRQARLVGYALHSVSSHKKIPWHRVINARGEISALPDPDSRLNQRYLLESEGVVFDERDRVNLERFGWKV